MAGSHRELLEYVEAVLDGSIVSDVADFIERLNDTKASFVNLLRYKAPVTLLGPFWLLK